MCCCVPCGHAQVLALPTRAPTLCQCEQQRIIRSRGKWICRHHTAKHSAGAIPSLQLCTSNDCRCDCHLADVLTRLCLPAGFPDLGRLCPAGTLLQFQCIVLLRSDFIGSVSPARRCHPGVRGKMAPRIKTVRARRGWRWWGRVVPR